MREQYAFECYTAHFGSQKYHVCQDITKAKIDVPDHDLLVGGFPCQDYSIMKKNSAGIEGTKGALWWQIDDILREKRPKYVLLENVDRLIRSPAKQSGRDFSIILRCLYEKGYAVEWRVINAADYGYAQRRRRTFIMAYHNQTEIFRNLAEAVCVQGLKSMHKHVMEKGIFAKAFPVQDHSRSYVESWIDELEYADISTVSRDQRNRQTTPRMDRNETIVAERCETFRYYHIGGIGMTSAELKHRAKLQEWAARIQDCRSSGLSVRAWCRQEEINASTYYRWERELLTAADQAPCSGVPAVTFAELPEPKKMSRNVSERCATLRIGSASLDIYPGCDAEQLRLLVELLRLC